jgi:hypothetical protein
MTQKTDLAAKSGSVEFGLEALRLAHARYQTASAELEERATELKPEILEHYRAELRKEYAEKARAIYERHVQRFEGLPAEMRAGFDPAALKRASRFDPKDDTADAIKSLAFGTRLANMPAHRLAELAAEIAEAGDFAKASYLEDFLASRGDAIPNDVRGFAEEKLGSMAYSGPEVDDVAELEQLVFEAQQVVNEVSLGGRLYSREQLESMDQPTFEDCIKRQRAAGLKQ